MEIVSHWHYQKAGFHAAPCDKYKISNVSSHCIQFRLPMPKPQAHHPGTITIIQPPKINSTAFNDDDDCKGSNKKKKKKEKKKEKKKSNSNATPTTSTPTDILRLMDGLGLPIPPDIYASLIKESSTTGDATQATQLLAHINRSGLPLSSALLNPILLMYVSCGLIHTARHMFDKMNVLNKNSISWAIMLAAYMDNGFYEEAIFLFVQMMELHSTIMLELPAWIFICVLKACVHTMNLTLGKQVHGWLLKVGYATNLFLSCYLISFYGKFRCLDDADFVFDQTSERNTVIWTAKMVNKCQGEYMHEALVAFTEMGRAGVKRNEFTYSSVLRACGRMKDHGRCGRLIHASTIKLGLESDIYVQCGLVDMYGKCGLLVEARRVFETVSDTNKTNIVCWNAMLTGYIRHGLYIEAIKFLYQMKAAGIQPQESLLNELRIACGSTTLENKTDGMQI